MIEMLRVVYSLNGSGAKQVVAKAFHWTRGEAPALNFAISAIRCDGKKPQIPTD